MTLTTAGTQRVTANGCELRFARRGRGRPVLLLHTLRTQLEYFGPLMDALADAAVDLIAVDLPGHGESAAPPVGYTASYFTDTVEAFLEEIDVTDVVVVGESIGAVIGLLLASRGNRRVGHLVALNPYDYGRRGGIRRSSLLANVLFTAMLWRGVGWVVARAGTKGILRRVMEGGVHDRTKLPPWLLAQLWRCGSLPGHARAFRSLCLEWRTWVAARERYAGVSVPVVLAYAEHDWSRPPEREANGRAIPGARRVSLSDCGHFSCLERPGAVARLVIPAAGRPPRHGEEGTP